MRLNRWWQETDDADCAQRVMDEAHNVDKASVDRQQAMLDASCLYGDASAWAWQTSAVMSAGPKLSHNVLANAVDSLVAEISQTEPRPMFVSIGGGYGERKRAEKLTAYMDTVFQQCNVSHLGPQALRDGILAGLGALRPYAEGDRIRIERIHPLNLLIDDRACVDVAPRTIYIRRAIARDHLSAIHPGFADAVEGAEGPEHSYWFVDSSVDSDPDLVEVIEAWHLPSRVEGDDGDEWEGGRHVVAVSSGLLIDEAYGRDEFPLAFVCPVPPQRGFWGEALALRGRTAQAELNKLLYRIQRNMHLYSKLWMFVQQGSGVNLKHLTNETGTAITYSGQPPVMVTPSAMAAEVYKHRDWLVQAIYDGIGASRMSAEGMKPAGINSGRAIRMWRDLGSRKHVNPSRAYERMYLDLAREVVHLEGQLAEEDPSREVIYEVHGVGQRIKWSEINLDEEAHRLQLKPVSALSTSASVRMDEIQELVEGGLVSPEQAIGMADNPDFKSIADDMTAGRDSLAQMFDAMLDGGPFHPPEPFQDIALGIRLAITAYQRAQLQGCPDGRLELLRTWIDSANKMMDRAAAEASAEEAAMAQPPMPMDPMMGPPPMPPGPMPPGPPMPPPGGPPPPMPGDLPPGIG